MQAQPQKITVFVLVILWIWVDLRRQRQLHLEGEDLEVGNGKTGVEVLYAYHWYHLIDDMTISIYLGASFGAIHNGVAAEHGERALELLDSLLLELIL